MQGNDEYIEPGGRKHYLAHGRPLIKHNNGGTPPASVQVFTGANCTQGSRFARIHNGGVTVDSRQPRPTALDLEAGAAGAEDRTGGGRRRCC